MYISLSSFCIMQLSNTYEPTSSVCLHPKTAHLNKTRKEEAKIYALKKFIPKPIEGQFILNIQKVAIADTDIVPI